VALADGSTVTLNTDSEIQVSLGAGHRDIRLVRGEALFHVAHNPDWPFDVTAEEVTVRAVGTAFDVRITEDYELQLLVTEGRVRIGRSGEFHSGYPNSDVRLQMVEANSSAVAHAGTISVTKHRDVEIRRRLAWTTGKLDLQQETLAAIVREVNRYNKKKIEIRDPTIAQRESFGMIFSPTDLDTFFQTLNRFGIATAEVGRTLDGSTVYGLCRQEVAQTQCFERSVN
jgi:transmembrane sensor